jgi:phage tail-like protein
MADASYFPPVGFFFEVTIFDPASNLVDGAHFQEVSGIEVSLETEDYGEGGNNLYKQKIPKAPSYSNLVLKRGLLTLNDPDFTNWVKETILSEGRFNDSEGIVLKNIMVKLKDPSGSKDQLMNWVFYGAYPVKWSISGFNAEENSIVTETLEFAYRNFNINVE